MAQESAPIINELLNESNEWMDELFKEAFESFEQCKKQLDRLQLGAAVSTSTPAAEI